MWRSPNHPLLQQSSASSPPEQRGEQILAIERQGDELRVCIDEYNSHKYVSLRIWSKNTLDGQLWPVKGKGLSIRASELAQVAKALEEADMQINHGYGQ